MVDPRCPFCNRQGLAGISGKKLSADYVVIYCSQCGAIYGVVPVSAPTPAVPPSVTEKPAPSIFKKPANPAPSPVAPAKPALPQGPTPDALDGHQLAAVMAATQGGLYYHFFGGSETDENEPGQSQNDEKS